MSPLVRHLFLPLLAPLALIGLYFTPVTAVGCVNRGLMAIAVVTISTLSAVYATFRGGVAVRQRDSRHLWWVISALILLLPALLLLGPLG